MIISNLKGCAFIHIPKCAGTHIKNALQPYNDGEVFTKRIATLGPYLNVDYAHIPLSSLRKYKKDVFDNILRYQSYAVIRDPVDRFYSAVAQYIKKTSGKALKDTNISDIKKFTLEVVEWLKENGDIELYPAEYIYFMPQIRYIELEGQIVVNNIYKIGNLNNMIEDLSRYMNVDLRVESQGAGSNKTVEYRNPVLKYIFQRSVRVLLRKFKAFFPRGFIVKIMHLIYKPSNGGWKESVSSDDITTFITEFYSRDFKIFESMG